MDIFKISATTTEKRYPAMIVKLLPIYSFTGEKVMVNALHIR